MKPDASNVGAPPDKTRRRPSRIRLWWWRQRVHISLFLLLVAFLIVYLAPRIFYTIDAGHAGVLWRRFAGGVKLDYVAGEGMHIIPPWDRLTIYEVRIQQEPIRYEVLTSEALAIEVALSIRYHPIYDELPMLHRYLGPDYMEKVVIPEVEAAIRKIFGQYTAEEIYGTQRDVLEHSVRVVTTEVHARFLRLDDLLLKQIVFPESYRQAIERKKAQHQAALEYQYRLDRERQEAERKEIEATGIRAFQDLIHLSPEYLAYRGIEATLALAASQNSKVVVIGRGKDGLPLILDLGGSGDGGIPTIGDEVDRPSRSDRVSTNDLPAFLLNSAPSSRNVERDLSDLPVY